MGLSIIYLEDTKDGVSVTCEHLYEIGESYNLTREIVSSLLFTDRVFYSSGSDITIPPVSPIIQ
jgi:hypothetical protein